MGKKNTRQFMSNISDVTHDDKGTIVTKNAPGKIGTVWYKSAVWEEKCKLIFGRRYKDLNTILNVQANVDPIINTLSKLSSRKGGVFVFKNYDMLKHLVFLGYEENLLCQKFGLLPLNDTSTYLAYIEERKKIFVCHNIKASTNVNQHMMNVKISIAYFLTLFSKKIKSGVRIIGLLIQETESKRQPLQCKFCDLFSASHKVFESPTCFDNWWKPIETYNDWWDFSDHAERCNLFEDLAAPILGFLNPELVCDQTLDKRDTRLSTLSHRGPDSGYWSLGVDCGKDFESSNISGSSHSNHAFCESSSREKQRHPEFAGILSTQDKFFSRNTETSSFQQQQLNEKHKNNLRQRTVPNPGVHKSLETNNVYYPTSMADRLFLLLLMLSSLSLHICFVFH